MPFRVLSLLLILAAFGLADTLDPAFTKVPFDQWIAAGDQKNFHWSANVTRAQLSFHQRLMAEVVVEIDGKDLEPRRTHGHIILLVQVTDHAGTRFQFHGSVELDKVDENIKAAIVQSIQRVFILPGDYQLGAVVLDTQTREHSALQMRFKIAGPQHGFLADAWRNLPSVEVLEEQQSPESWYLPNVQGRLQYAAPPNMSVLLNVAPAQRSPGLAALLPTLKVLSLAQKVELIDLSRRRAVFHQEDSQPLNWPVLKASLADSTTASIDLHSLSERHQEAPFFVSEIRRVLRASQAPCVLVVLTTPVAFEQGEDLSPISTEALPACRVFYIRYHPLPQRPHEMEVPRRGLGRREIGGGPGMRPMGRGGELDDQLEATLKPLKPKLFDVATPDDIARALQEIIRTATLQPDPGVKP